MKKHDRNIMLIKLVLLSAFAVVVLYPLVWMIGSSFKAESDIFKDMGLIPKAFTLENYAIGWESSGKTTFTTYFLNSFLIF